MIHTCTKHPAGTPACYYLHACRCDHCKAANARYTKRLRTRGQGRRVSSVGIRRRLQALMAIGWTAQHLADTAGWGSRQTILNLLLPTRRYVNPDTAAKVHSLYDRLSMTPGPSVLGRARAARAGWVPPLGWDDIDTDEAPAVTPPRQAGGRAEDAVWLARCGERVEVIADRMGIQPGAVEHLLYRAGRADLISRIGAAA